MKYSVKLFEPMTKRGFSTFDVNAKSITVVRNHVERIIRENGTNRPDYIIRVYEYDSQTYPCLTCIYGYDSKKYKYVLRQKKIHTIKYIIKRGY